MLKFALFGLAFVITQPVQAYNLWIPFLACSQNEEKAPAQDAQKIFRQLERNQNELMTQVEIGDKLVIKDRGALYLRDSGYETCNYSEGIGLSWLVLHKAGAHKIYVLETSYPLRKDCTRGSMQQIVKEVDMTLGIRSFIALEESAYSFGSLPEGVVTTFNYSNNDLTLGYQVTEGKEILHKKALADSSISGYSLKGEIDLTKGLLPLIAPVSVTSSQTSESLPSENDYLSYSETTYDVSKGHQVSGYESVPFLFWRSEDNSYFSSPKTWGQILKEITPSKHGPF